LPKQGKKIIPVKRSLKFNYIVSGDPAPSRVTDEWSKKNAVLPEAKKYGTQCQLFQKQRLV
jgi:hypothetical protein